MLFLSRNNERLFENAPPTEGCFEASAANESREFPAFYKIACFSHNVEFVLDSAANPTQLIRVTAISWPVGDRKGPRGGMRLGIEVGWVRKRLLQKI